MHRISYNPLRVYWWITVWGLSDTDDMSVSCQNCGIFGDIMGYPQSLMFFGRLRLRRKEGVMRIY